MSGAKDAGQCQAHTYLIVCKMVHQEALVECMRQGLQSWGCRDLTGWIKHVTSAAQDVQSQASHVGELDVAMATNGITIEAISGFKPGAHTQRMLMLQMSKQGCRCVMGCVAQQAQGVGCLSHGEQNDGHLLQHVTCVTLLPRGGTKRARRLVWDTMKDLLHNLWDIHGLVCMCFGDVLGHVLWSIHPLITNLAMIQESKANLTVFTQRHPVPIA